MYETLTGELPIRAHHRKELLELHQSQIPVSMAASMPELGIPARLDDTVMVCLEKRPAARPLSALALAEKLEEVAFELRPDSARTPSHVRPFRRISGDFSRADGDARRTLASLLGADPEGDEEEKT
jgi:hypothetical protein